MIAAAILDWLLRHSTIFNTNDALESPTRSKSQRYPARSASGREIAESHGLNEATLVRWQKDTEPAVPARLHEVAVVERPCATKGRTLAASGRLSL